MTKFKISILFTIINLFSLVNVSSQSIVLNIANKNNEQPLAELKQCLQNKVKYPLFMQIYKLEGRVFVLLNINEKGKVVKIKVEADYFGKTYSLDKISNKNRIERLRSKIEKRLIPLFTECTKNISFAIPKNENEKILKVPVSFGIFGDIDDYGISDDYDDYDYNDDIDYHYFEHD